MAARPAPTTPAAHTIDLLLATELLGTSAEPAATLVDPPGLHVCPDCRLAFVIPGQVREVIGTDRVRLELACANCPWTTVSVHHDSELSTLDEQLDRSYADLLWTLEIVWTANEEAAIEQFARALGAGAILPEDF